MNVSPQYSLHTGGSGTSTLNRDDFSQPSLPLKPTARRTGGRNVFLDLPIGWRLALGFMIAALVAALASGAVGLQRSQSLSKQTDFYQTLLQLNTSLTTGHSFLELMGSKLQQTLLDASVANPSRETLANDVGAITNLTTLYTQTLNSYAQNDLLNQHPDQMALLNEANEDDLASQQLTLVSSTQRTWQVYEVAQQQILTDISNGDLQDANLLLQGQGQPTNDDAQSALQSLIQLDARLASAVDSATNVEVQNQLLTTLIATLCAFLTIALVGWFISDTLVRRLRQLHRVTRAVEEGRINERVLVSGRDEIADVSVAVNSMVDTITGLLEETRHQRDALAGAAEHLFSDMRIVNAGDLRISAPVSNDPIGMLANAFNFTVGRFRRFILRTQTTIEQLDVVSRQGMERSSIFISLVRSQLHDVPSVRNHGAPAPDFGKTQPPSGPLKAGTRKPASPIVQNDDFSALGKQIQQTQDVLIRATRDDLQKRLGITRETVEAASLSIGRMSELISTRSGTYAGNMTEKMTQAQIQELLGLEKLLRKLFWEVQQAQFNVNSNFTKIDAAFTRLTHSLADLPASAPVTEQAEGLLYLSDPQFQEFARQAGGFAVEVNTLSKRLAAIIHEMRTGITPFRLDGATSLNDSIKPTGTLGNSDPFQPAPPNGNLISSW
jgi:methyl-accepting chemotaxis protein